jgi:transcriptional regulator with XRE-family HTH domain
MNIKLGDKIKSLRKQKNISQEVLAQFLSVSFQAVSKWENEAAMPDVTLIPAIASFFGVSTDELFDFNLMEIEKKVNDICTEALRFYSSDPQKCEKILRAGLKKYPGNDILLNNLIGIIPIPERSSEVIDICKALIESTKYGDVKYDALRIMAEAYKTTGEYALAKKTIEQIPEIYFTKLEVAAKLLDGEDMYESANRQKSNSAWILVDMLIELSDYYSEKGEDKKALTQLHIAKSVIEAFKDDFATEYSKQLYDAFSDELGSIDKKIKAIS